MRIFVFRQKADESSGSENRRFGAQLYPRGFSHLFTAQLWFRLWYILTVGLYPAKPRDG